MRFPPVPSESKSAINRAGQLLAKGEGTFQKNLAAIRLVNRWRACHAYPINTFQSTLRSKLRHYECDTLAAQRLKRMPTIIQKLRIYPNMQLTTMQDIAGVRAVLESISDVDKLVQEYKDGSRFRHQLSSEYDYINFPRDQDGYRSHHLIYKYRNLKNPHYDGLRVELQVRTKLQHTWATAVETMGTFLGQALKSRQGDKEWLDFFAIVSSAFAHQEKTPPLPRFSNLSRKETYSAVADAENDVKAIEKMHAFSIAVDHITTDESTQAYTYHLIILNSMEKQVEIQAYSRESFDEAVDAYTKAEERAASGEKIEPVLVSAGRVDTLRRAYPNFFLDIRDFMKVLVSIVSKAK